MKICIVCKQNLDESQFYKRKDNIDGLRNDCKNCNKKYHKNYREDNKEILIEKSKQDYKKNREKRLNKNKEYNRLHKKEIKEYIKNYYENNKKKIKKYLKQYNKTNKRKEYLKNYYLENKENIRKKTKEYRQYHRKKINERQQNKRKNNLNFRMLCNLRVRLNSTYLGKTRSGHMLDYIGCSQEFLQEHILNQLAGEMTEENYGTIWEIDHILPCASFDLTKEENIFKCFNYKNLQPLLCSENRSKKDKLNWKKENV